MSTGVSTAIGRIVWHDHISEDAGRAQEFYKQLLGWETEIWKPGEMDYPMIIVGGQMHGGFGPAQGRSPARWLCHVCVDNTDEPAARATANGGEMLGSPRDIPEVGRMAVIRDPQGAVISLFSPQGDAPPQTTGAFEWDELWTTDLEGAKKFYGAVIGWRANEMSMGDAGTYVLFGIGDKDSAGCTAIQPDMQVPPNWLAYLHTDDIEATLAKAPELGGSVMMPRMDMEGIGAFAVLTDTVGATFGVLQPAT
jgi:predicted enzyme related to lactoylglutathione lyase